MREIAREWHGTQVRKYSGEPYIVHTTEVAAIVATVSPGAESGIAIAHGHDLFEDTPLTATRLAALLLQKGHDIHSVSLVVRGINDLTDIFVPEGGLLNRENRKRMEHDRLGALAPGLQTIKLADIISNTRNLPLSDKFAATYLREMSDLIASLGFGSGALRDIARKQVNDALEEIQAEKRNGEVEN